MQNDPSIFRVFSTEKELLVFLNRATIENEEHGKFDFEQSEFNFKVNFRNVLREFDSIAVFKKARFTEECSFEGLTFKEQADFNGCVFESRCNFKNTTFEKDLTISSFQSFVSFQGAKFNSDTLWGTNFNGVNFSHCYFKNSLHLSERNFNGKLYINNSTFNGDVYFNNSTFQNKVNAWETKFNKNVIFTWANFKNKLNLTESEIKNGICDFYGVNFEENGYFYKTAFKELDLKNSVIEKGVFFLGATVKKSKRETNRIVKNQFLKQSNKIEALNFHHKEMKSYLAELLRVLPKNLMQLKLWSFLKDLSNIFILFFNFITNGFGLWWIGALLFLFLSTTVCFNLYLDNIETCADISYWRYYFDFINPTHKSDFIKIDHVFITDKAYIIDFFGRLLSSLGIFQTIQAFRKYGKI